MSFKEQPQIKKVDKFVGAEEIDKHINERLAIYLADLKLTIKDLHNKHILDVGSGGDRAFALAAKKQGIEIVSIDRDEFMASSPQEKTPYVQGVAEVLPFHNNSFDLTISHESFPMIAHPKNLPDGHIEEWSDLNRFRQAVETGISEMMRVTKREGEVRLGPILADPKQGYNEFNVKELEVIHSYLAELKNQLALEVLMVPVRGGDLLCIIIRRRLQY